MTEAEQSCDACRKDIRRLEEQIRAAEGLTREQFRGRDEQTKTALASMDERLKLINEFRHSLNDLSVSMLTKASFELTLSGLVRELNTIRNNMATAPRVAALEDRMNKIENEQSGLSGKLWPLWIFLGAGITAIFSWMVARFNH